MTGACEMIRKDGLKDQQRNWAQAESGDAGASWWTDEARRRADTDTSVDQTLQQWMAGAREVI